MKAAQQVITNQRLRAQSAWTLLMLDNAPVALGLLQVHLLDKEKRLPHSILLERLRQDLEQLRRHGVDLPQTPEAYLSSWLRAGYLVRSFHAGASEEEYSLSVQAVRAVQFIHSLESKRVVATESRLSLVISQLHELARQTEPDPEVRIEALLKERARIDAEIDAARSGEAFVLPEERALERVREVIALAQELTTDFRSVQEEFQGLNRSLREQIVENEGSRGDVLEKVFAGVDVIADSDAGKTFRAFWRLLTDPEQALAFDTALERVLSRDFAGKLDRHERRFLMHLTRLLLENGGEVHEVFQHFARGLKQFVQTRAYQEQRHLNLLLTRAQRDAMTIKEAVKPQSDLRYPLELTSAHIRSLAQWQLYDPSKDQLEGGIARAQAVDISLESVGELLANSEIDFRRLREQLDSLLAQHAHVSIAQVLQAFPAEQGLGSVIGLLAMGAKDGIVTKQFDEVSWQGHDKVTRRARIPRIYFYHEKVHAQAG